MTALDLINELQRMIEIHGNLEIYRPLNEGCNHCTITNIGRLSKEDEFDVDSDGNDMPEFFFKLDNGY
jgi:hypothetical protein